MLSDLVYRFSAKLDFPPAVFGMGHGYTTKPDSVSQVASAQEFIDVSIVDRRFPRVYPLPQNAFFICVGLGESVELSRLPVFAIGQAVERRSRRGNKDLQIM